MALREFQNVRTIKDGRPMRGYRMNCTCGTSDTISIGTMSRHDAGDKEHAIVARKFEARGWAIGKTKSKDRCPACVAKTAKEKAAAKATAEQRGVYEMPEAKETANNVTITDDQILAGLSHDDRRLIFAKLHEVYLSPEKGYAEDWTDNRVASDLGVAIKTVSAVRATMFGPVRNNEIFPKHIAEVRREIAAWNRHYDEFRKLQAETQGLVVKMKILIEEMKPITARIDKLEKRTDILENTTR